jgi:hypothetical protein
VLPACCISSVLSCLLESVFQLPLASSKMVPIACSFSHTRVRVAERDERDEPRGMLKT